jgi:Flp pilus assembly protein TadG
MTSGLRLSWPSFHDDSGATAVEFAIVSSVFITLVLGVFWIGWGLYCGADVRHAIERASRLYLSTPQASDQQFEAAVGASLTAVPLSDIGFSITKPTISGAAVAQIAWTYHYTVTVPFIQPVVMDMSSQILAPIRPG